MYPGLGLFLVAVGLILEFVPRGDNRTLALNAIGLAMVIIGIAVLITSLIRQARRWHARLSRDPRHRRSHLDRRP